MIGRSNIGSYTLGRIPLTRAISEAGAVAPHATHINDHQE